MNAWLGPVALRPADRRPSLGGFHQGLYRPPPLRRPGLGITGAFPFPEIKVVQGSPSPLTGFVPQGIKDGVLIGLGGAAIAYTSRFLPGMAEMVSLVGGVGLIGFGIFKVYDAVSGNAAPNIEKFHGNPAAPADALSVIKGQILLPTSNGQAELSSMWAQIFDAQRTFKIKFVVSNDDKDPNGKPVQVLVEFNTEQVSRPFVGEPEISNFSTSYVIDDLGPGDSKVVPGFQPVGALANVLQPQSYRSQDVTATLLARVSAKGQKKQLDQIKFTIW